MSLALALLAGIVVGWVLAATSRRQFRGSVLTPRATPTRPPAPTRLTRITGSPPPPPPPPKRENAHPEMQPPPSWWSRDQWNAAMRAVDQCRCDPYDCGPYGHDDDCPAGMLSQGQYNAVKGE